jgi:hypothetical protein
MDIGDVDADGVDEFLIGVDHVSTSETHIFSYDFATETIEWESTPVPGAPIVLKVADVTEDGVPDVIAANSDRTMDTLYVYDVFNQVLVWQKTIPIVTDIEAFGDYSDRFVVATRTALELYTRIPGTGGFVVSATQSFEPHGIWDLATGDVLDDGTTELYATYESGGFTPDRLLSFDPSLQLLNNVEIPATSMLVFVEELGYSRKNLVLSHHPVQGSGSWLSTIDPISGAEIMTSPQFRTDIARNSLGYAYSIDDGRTRLSFSTQTDIYLTR